MINAYVTNGDGNQVRPAELVNVRAERIGAMLGSLSRDILRDMARRNGVKTGRDKQDTIRNLTKANVGVTLAVVAN